MFNFLFIYRYLFIGFSIPLMAEKLTASYLLYSEAFTSQNGKGVYGPLPTADLSGVNWGLDFSYASLTAADDYAKVVSESFEFQDTDGIVSLESPFKDTSGFTNFFVEFELSESGDLEGTDMIETFYTLNNGTSYTSIDTRSGNFSDDNLSDSLIVYIDEGNSIGLKFEAISNASGEFLRVDNLAIKSDTLNGASLEINSTNLADFSNEFEIYQGEFFLGDQINFDKNLTLSAHYVTLYEEGFTGENDQGVTGNGSNLSGVDWNVTSSGNLSDQNDYLKVTQINGNELFEFRDLAGNAYWTSPELNSSGYESLRLSMSLSETGTMESNDLIGIEYSLDNGSSFTTLFSQNDDFSTYDLNESIVDSSSLTFRVKVYNSADDEKHRFDDLVLLGLGNSVIGENTGGESEFSGSVILNRPVKLKAAENGKVTFNGQVSGNGISTKQGKGIVALTDSSSTYSGNIVIEEGKLEIGSDVSLPGTISGSGNEKSVLGGKGSVHTATIGNSSGEIDFISPGLGLASSMSSSTSLNQSISKNNNATVGDFSDDAEASIGSFTTTTLGLNDGGVYDWELKDFNGTTPGTDWDVLSFTNLSFGSLGSSFTINILPIKAGDGTAGSPENSKNLWAQHGSSFKFLDGPDGGSGITWGDWTEGNINEFFNFQMKEFSYYTDFYYNDWNVSYLNGDFYLNYSAVPEPSTYLMSSALLLVPAIRSARHFYRTKGKHKETDRENPKST